MLTSRQSDSCISISFDDQLWSPVNSAAQTHECNKAQPTREVLVEVWYVRLCFRWGMKRIWLQNNLQDDVPVVQQMSPHRPPGCAHQTSAGQIKSRSWLVGGDTFWCQVWTVSAGFTLNLDTPGYRIMGLRRAGLLFGTLPCPQHTHTHIHSRIHAKPPTHTHKCTFVQTHLSSTFTLCWLCVFPWSITVWLFALLSAIFHCHLQRIILSSV